MVDVLLRCITARPSAPCDWIPHPTGRLFFAIPFDRLAHGEERIVVSPSILNETSVADDNPSAAEGEWNHFQDSAIGKRLPVIAVDHATSLFNGHFRRQH